MRAEEEPSFEFFKKMRTVYKEVIVSGESLHLYREIHNHNCGIQINKSLDSIGRLNFKGHKRDGEAAASILISSREIWKYSVDLWAI